ncbi:MAG: LamG domain-containing protein [Planctomycetes bacterium]|nr:LamG domain-containing protein [Planctomycetota bacterium]
MTAGNTGFDEVAVTLEKRAIPIDLEGQDPPPPPPPPVPETRGRWEFGTVAPPPPFAPVPLPFETVAACRVGDRIELFVNGVPGGGYYWSYPLPPWTYVYPGYAPFRVGMTSYMNGDRFGGLIDEVRLSSSARYVPVGVFTTDESAYQNHAQLLNGALLDGGLMWLPNAWSDYAATQPSPALALGGADFTIEVSVQPGYYTFINLLSGPGYSLTVDGDGRVTAYLTGALGSSGYAQLVSNTTLGAGGWNTVTLTRAGDTITLFINGYEDTSATFYGSLLGTEGALTVGPFYPLYWNVPYWDWYTETWVDCWYWGYGPVGIDRVAITATPEPPAPVPGTIYASIYIPVNPDPEAIDTIHYFHGLRDATINDPAFTETGPGTLVFLGTFAGVETTISIDPATFPGLTENVDSFRGTVLATFNTGTQAPVAATFIETSTVSCVFRGTLPSTGDLDDEIPAYWAGNAQNKAGDTVPNYFPVMPRFVGLPATAVELGYRLSIDGADYELEALHGCFYAKSASPLAGVYLKTDDGRFKIAKPLPLGAAFVLGTEFAVGATLPPGLGVKIHEAMPAAPERSWPYGVQSPITLEPDTPTKPTHWHNRTGKLRPWYFSGPYYTKNEKFHYRVLGYKGPQARVLLVVKDKDGVIWFQESLLNHEGAWFTGEFAGKYLHPMGSPFTVGLALSLQGTHTAFQWRVPFDVRSRTIVWYDTRDEGSGVESFNSQFYPRYVAGRDGTITYAPRDQATVDTSDSSVLVCEGDPQTPYDWARAYGLMTVAGTMYSLGHGGPADYVGQEPGTLTSSYGLINLHRWVAGFADPDSPGGVFAGYAVLQQQDQATALLRQALSQVQLLPSYRLNDMTLWLKHCFSAARSQTGWPWPLILLQGNGRSVADTLKRVITSGGSGRVWGYATAYTFEPQFVLHRRKLHVVPMDRETFSSLRSYVLEEAVVEDLALVYGFDLKAQEAALKDKAKEWIIRNVAGVNRNDPRLAKIDIGLELQDDPDEPQPVEGVVR